VSPKPKMTLWTTEYSGVVDVKIRVAAGTGENAVIMAASDDDRAARLLRQGDPVDVKSSDGEVYPGEVHAVLVNGDATDVQVVLG
jgi:hypothetical protein